MTKNTYIFGFPYGQKTHPALGYLKNSSITLWMNIQKGQGGRLTTRQGKAHFTSQLGIRDLQATEREIADCLRHENTTLVQRYAHLSQTHLRGVMEKVSAFGKQTKEDAISVNSVDRSEIKEAVEPSSKKVNLQPVE
jgi:hypothetical protein